MNFRGRGHPDFLCIYVTALKNMNTALFTGLETALIVMEKWDNMPEKKTEDIISSLKYLIENNRAAFSEKPTMN